MFIECGHLLNINQMKDNKTDNKRLAKNTLFLYFRMFLTLIVGLYTSRVVLHVLGVVDYGIYNVIGGIVAIFASLNGAMASTSSRYITFYLGRNNFKKLNKVFNTVAFIHLGIAIIVILLCETIGLWFFYTHMKIPVARISVAFWLLQFSFAATFLDMINIPYTGLIIAHEKMDIYAYISIFDVIAKLIIVFLLKISPIDKLFSYGLLILVVQTIDFVLYRTYCVRHYLESHIKLVFDKNLFRELFSYFGWSIFGNVALVFNTQGINLVLNVFFGPVVNAARGVAVQVQSVINQFVSNFQIALNPQIVKNYAEKEMDRMYQLMFASAKYGFLLLFFLSLPVMIEAKELLTIWLGIIPEHTVNFIRIILFTCLIDSLANSLTVAAGATGKIKSYSLVVGGIVLLPLPFSYLVFKFFGYPELAFLNLVIFDLVALITRLFFIKKMISMSLRAYLKKVIVPILKVISTSIWFPLLFYKFSSINLLTMLVDCMICVVSVSCSIYLLGLNIKEQSFIKQVVATKLKAIRK